MYVFIYAYMYRFMYVYMYECTSTYLDDDESDHVVELLEHR
jgi:hypothetical protein